VRQVILDTETTGLEHAQGHRIIEIGAVEMIERRLTGRRYHQYLNPDREVDEGAMNVHGISNEFLLDKPRFPDIHQAFLEFIEGSELLIHNARFDVGFLDAEFEAMGSDLRIADVARVTDTLKLAAEFHPGQQNNLDALCRRYDIDNSSRTLHGALLDAEILAEVFLAMTGGQTDLALDVSWQTGPGSGVDRQNLDLSGLEVARPSDEELAAHRQRLESIRDKAGHCIWLDGARKSSG